MTNYKLTQKNYENIVMRISEGNIDASHDIGHLRRVWKNCQKINDEEQKKCDTQVLLAAAYFHDLFNPPKNSSERKIASCVSADKAEKILRGLDFPKHKLDEVLHAIESHSFSGGIEPKTQEARVLHDADKLESIGAIGIARVFYVSGRINSAMFDYNDPLANSRELDDNKYALDHFKTKLFLVANSMKTKAGLAIARDRTEIMQNFYDIMLSEIE